MVVHSPDAPSFPSILSQGRVCGNLLFTSGLVPMSPGEHDVCPGGITEQTRLVLENLGHVLKAAGSSLRHVLKVTVFLADMADYRAMNDEYRRFFAPPLPARSCVAVKALALPAMRVELEAVAEIPGADGGSRAQR
ncbi:MAG: RidA family protein [Planctomycetes bacterium]|nr:RidA family protein [Planctomycetota bacterium]